jgi:hypothetical protein
MTKRGLVFGTMAVLGLHVGAYLASTEQQRKKVARFMNDHPGMTIAATTVTLYTFAELFSKSSVSRSTPSVGKLVINLPREFYEAMQQDWSEGNSAFLEIDPTGATYKVTHNRV